MGMAARVEVTISGFDLWVDPGVRAVGPWFRAHAHDLTERLVGGDGEAFRPHRLGQRVRQAEAVERKDAAPLRLDPEDLPGVATVGHRKHANGVSAKQQIGVETRHPGWMLQQA
ncbi:hypothetical protein ACFB49_03250 [Sphingomonas sp. DBB INV C78]